MPARHDALLPAPPPADRADGAPSFAASLIQSGILVEDDALFRRALTLSEAHDVLRARSIRS